MKDEDRYLEYLKATIMRVTISNLLDPFLLLALWHLGYHTAFWVCLAVIIFNSIGQGFKIIKLEEKAKVN